MATASSAGAISFAESSARQWAIRAPISSTGEAAEFLARDDVGSSASRVGGRSRCPWVTVGDSRSGLFWHGRGLSPAAQFASVDDG